MPNVEIRLFGGVEIHVDAKPVKGLVSRKGDALVAYLACNPALHARERLADLLWDDRNLSTAMGNLRVLLNSIRNQLVPPVVITRNTVHMDLAEDVWVDCLVFEQLLEPLSKGTHQQLPQATTLPSTVVDNLHRALSFYQGEFAAGFHLREAHQFDDWVMLERERYHIAAVNAIQALVCHYMATKQFTLGINTTQRWLQIDYFNEAAHRLLMELLAHVGQHTAALDHYQQYVLKLTAENLEPSPITSSLYQQLARDTLSAQAEQLKRPTSLSAAAAGNGTVRNGTIGDTPSNTVPNNLPATLTPLIGRATELTTIHQRLLDPHCRLLTIVGLGGVGKTHLATEAAQQLTTADAAQMLFRDGIFLVRLDRLEPDQLMPSVIANAINFTFQGALDQQAQLFRYLRGRHMLVILDNFEHLLHHADFVDELLQQAPNVKVLVTSRERLEFMGEWLLPVEGLPSPPAAEKNSAALNPEEAAAHGSTNGFRPAETEITINPWHTYPAPQLFIHTAQAVHPNFIAERQKDAIIAICQMVEGLPLGIQLAAAAINAHACTEIVDAVRRNLDAINTKMRNMPERHRSLRAVFTHSWELLTPIEQRAFADLAIFVDGFSAESAKLIANISHELLDALQNKSLVQQMEVQTGTHSAQLIDVETHRRYRLHPVLHHYAGLELAKSAAHEGRLRHQHCLYFCRFAAEREAALNQLGAGAAADAIATELENLRAGWRYALSQGLDELLLFMAPGLIRFYLRRGYLQDALAMLQAAIATVAAWLPAVAADSPTTMPPQQRRRQTLLANLFVHSAEVHTELGQYDKAAKAAQNAINHAQRSGSAVGEALGHLHWGIALNYLGDYRQAKQKLQLAIDEAQQHALPSVEARAQRHMGVNHFYQGDYTGGRLQHENAIRYYQETGNLFQELRTYHSLAMRYFYTGDYLQARRHYEHCLEMYKTMGDRATIALTLNNLGAISTQLGDYTQAHRSFEEALEIRRRLGDRQMEGLILANLGLLMHLMNNHRQALAYCTQALEVSLEIGERDTEAYTRTCLAHAQLELGQVADAIANYELAVGMRKSAEQQTQMLEPLAGLARAYLRLREPKQALHYVEEILTQLDRDTYAGIVELIRIYLTCYRVLYLLEDPRAEELLHMGHATLQERAARIVDKDLRQLYLDNVVAHRELLTEYETQQV